MRLLLFFLTRIIVGSSFLRRDLQSTATVVLEFNSQLLTLHYLV